MTARALWLMVGAALLLLAGSVAVVARAPTAVEANETPPGAGDVAAQAPSAPALTHATIPATAGPAAAEAGPGVPVRLDLPSASVVVVATTIGKDGQLRLPDSSAQNRMVGRRAWPGSAKGAVVIAGHVDSVGGGSGVLAAVPSLPIGAPLVLTDRTAHAHRYVVQARVSYPKQALPDELFRLDGPPVLVLVTCGGQFDGETGQYADNIGVLRQTGVLRRTAAPRRFNELTVGSPLP